MVSVITIKKPFSFLVDKFISSDVTRDNIPLVVDLDGSFIKTELPWESFLYVLRKHPIELIKIIWRKLRIKKSCYFKIELQKYTKLSLDELLFSKTFLVYLKQQKNLGRTLILCTGSTQKYADEIQKLTGLFTSVWGSTLGTNLVGKLKAQFLVKQYGYKKFDYAGNSFADLKVLPFARNFIMVNPSVLAQLFVNKHKIHSCFKDQNLTFCTLINTLGILLWFLNCIVFILPVFLFVSPKTLCLMCFSVVYFNFLATGFNVFFRMIYISLNRGSKVTQKINNPFTTGDLSCLVGFYICILCFIVSLGFLIYLSLYTPFIIISSLFYIFGIYLLVYKKIIKYNVPIFIRYALPTAVILLHGYFII